jgi:hypothetical protein
MHHYCKSIWQENFRSVRAIACYNEIFPPKIPFQPPTLRLKAGFCDEKSCIYSRKHGTALHCTRNKCHKIFKTLLVTHNFSTGLKNIHDSLRPGPEMLFTHSPALPLFSETAGRYGMTKLHEKYPKFLKICASDEKQHQCSMQDGKYLFLF